MPEQDVEPLLEQGPGVQIVAEALDGLRGYGSIPIRFEVRSLLSLQVYERGLGGFGLQEEALTIPWFKDYDIEGNHPEDWALQFDLSHWGRLGAYSEGRRVGAALIACATPELQMLEGRSELAVLWDIRVDPAVRGQRIGARLFSACEQWATSHDCRQLKVETQNVNVPACRFYQRMGCELGGINRFAYPDFPQEVQLLWYKNLLASGHK